MLNIYFPFLRLDIFMLGKNDWYDWGLLLL